MTTLGLILIIAGTMIRLNGVITNRPTGQWDWWLAMALGLIGIIFII
jgi:hypothetical protein